MRNLRVERMTGLAVDIAQLLAGARGGFIGFASARRTGSWHKWCGSRGTFAQEKRTVRLVLATGILAPRILRKPSARTPKLTLERSVLDWRISARLSRSPVWMIFGRRIDDTTGEIIPWRESKAIELPDFADFFDTKKLDEEAPLLMVQRVMVLFQLAQ